MRLVDTSAWIEWLIGSSTGKAIRAELPSRDTWLVPTIVQLELAKWTMRNRGEEAVEQVVAFTMRCVVVNLDTRSALAAADVCGRHRLATADAVVYATAQAYGAEVLTCDAHFDTLPNVRLITKKGAG